MNASDVERARADTPGVANVLHFNNAGSALPPRPVVEAMIDYLRFEAEIGGYEAHDARPDLIERPYAALAQLLNAAPDEIAILDSATRAWDMAFYAMPFRPGDRILTGRSEYCSNFIASLHRARRDGVIIDVAPDTEYGEICTDGLRAMICDRTRLIAVTHVPTSSGLVNPVADIGKIARAAGVPFLLDATQSIGQMEVNVEAIGCDMLCGTARKYLRGPRGIGFLYVHRGFLGQLNPPFLDDHAAEWVDDDSYVVRDDARKFETAECGFAARVGFGVAVDYALGWSMPRIARRIDLLSTMLRERLAQTRGVRLHDTGRQRCGIVTFSLDIASADDVHRALASQLINVTVAEAAATQLDMVPRGLDRIVRASVHYYNSEEEIDRFALAIAELSRCAA